MWIKYNGTLYNMDKINTMAILYDRPNNCFVIGLEEHKAHFYEFGDMTKEEAEYAFKVICEQIDAKRPLIRLDEHLFDYRNGIA